MPYNGSGQFSPQVTFIPNGEALAEDLNAEFQDVAAGLSNVLTRDGQTEATANLSLGGYKITNVSPGTAPNDVATFGQAAGGNFAGTSAGSANAQIVTAPGFTFGDGQIVSFRPGFVNTGAMTLSPDNGTTAVPCVIDTSAGPFALLGNELVTGTFTTARYDLAANRFHVSTLTRSNTIAFLTAATTTDIGSLGTNTVILNNTSGSVVTITSFGSSASGASPFFDVIIAGPITLLQNASILFGAPSLPCSGGDVLRLFYQGGGVWRLVAYQPAANASFSPFITGETREFAFPNAPSGWLPCDGRAVSRTAYAALYNAIGTVWGAGDGTSTFNVPPLAGSFTRAWDASGTIDPGRTFGSFQDHQFQDHFHQLGYQQLAGGGAVQAAVRDYGSASSSTVTSSGALSGNRGTETRPRNYALLKCIKT